MDRPSSLERVIALIDMDCFYVQVEQREQPEYWGKPCAVVQYGGGLLLSINYEARAFGVKRGMSVPQCIVACRDIKLFRVPEVNGRGDLSKYIKASEEVFKVISEFDPSIVLEVASIDECFLDLTSLCYGNTEAYEDEDISNVKFPPDCENEDDDDARLLITGSKIVRRLRREIKEKTQFACSAGVSFNKILAKIACGIQKPDGQSVISPTSVPEIYKTVLISTPRGLGGKLGTEIMTTFKIKFMSELANVSEDDLRKRFGPKTAKWVRQLCNGIDHEPVAPRDIRKSIGCGKNFRGLKTRQEIMEWVDNLGKELIRRLEADRKANKRRAKNVIVNIREAKSGQSSRTIPLREYNKATLIEDVDRYIISKLPQSDGKFAKPIVNLSLIASKFIDYDPYSALDKTPSIRSFCQKSPKPALAFSETNVLPMTIEENSCDDDVVCLNDDTPSTNVPKIEGFFYRKTAQLMRLRKLSNVK